MASSSGGDAGDPKQKHGDGVYHLHQQQHAAGMGFNHYDKRNTEAPLHSFEFEHRMEKNSGSAAADSDLYKQLPFYDDAPSDEWQSSSPSSTRQMLFGGQHRKSNGSSSSSSSVASPPRPSRRFTPVAFVRKIDWGSLWDQSKEWIRNPMNMALFVWIVAVGVSGAILFMVMTGMLKHVLRTKSQRDTWFEVNNQILNALFTLMCLYQHPRRFYHLALLCRWRAGDMLQLRQVYCKDGTCKPSERKHMTVVVLLLHLNCFAQYALCGLNLGYRRPKRPVIGVALTISVAICAPAVAGLYSNLSPLGNDYEAQPQAEADEESSNNPQLQRKTLHLHHDESAFAAAASTRESTKWAGGLFDVWDDISLAYLSVFCSCCVLGWNVSRLGFGNMYVHIATFVLLCLAPFFIFDLAAINIENEDVRDALGLAGIFLCVLGLLYGGFWRIQMRRRFGLPASHACCGKADLTDSLHWLCCYSCALAQEVRTADALLLPVQDPSPSCSSSGSGRQTTHPIPTMQVGDEMHQPLRFSSPPPAAAAARPVSTSVNDGVVTVPPPVSVIHTTPLL